MTLIDWLWVVRNALWILGLGMVLATWSHIAWWARVHNLRITLAMKRAAYTVGWSMGMLFFSSSLAWGSNRWWERSLWILLALTFAWQALQGWRRERSSPGE